MSGEINDLLPKEKIMIEKKKQRDKKQINKVCT